MPKTQDKPYDVAGFVEAFAKAKVKHPETVKVTNLQGTQTQIIELSVAPEDAGLIIGKGGETVNGLKWVVSVLSKGQARVNLVGLPKREQK